MTVQTYIKSAAFIHSEIRICLIICLNLFHKDDYGLFYPLVLSLNFRICFDFFHDFSYGLFTSTAFELYSTFSCHDRANKFPLSVWLVENVEFHSTFSRHDRANKFPLSVWLTENVAQSKRTSIIPSETMKSKENTAQNHHYGKF